MGVYLLNGRAYQACLKVKASIFKPSFYFSPNNDRQTAGQTERQTLQNLFNHMQPGEGEGGGGGIYSTAEVAGRLLSRLFFGGQNNSIFFFCLKKIMRLNYSAYRHTYAHLSQGGRRLGLLALSNARVPTFTCNREQRHVHTTLRRWRARTHTTPRPPNTHTHTCAHRFVHPVSHIHTPPEPPSSPSLCESHTSRLAQPHEEKWGRLPPLSPFLNIAPPTPSLLLFLPLA